MKTIVKNNSNIPELDGFRAIAILMVLNFHFAVYIKFIPFYNLITGAGWLGVTLFFILSGFLLSLPWISAAKESSPLPDWKKFFFNRALRIFPLYYFSLIFFVLIQPALIKTAQININELIRHLFFLHNYQFGHSLINAPYWSLAVEVQFYIIMPVIGYFLYRTLREKRFKLLIFGILTMLIIPSMYRYGISSFADLSESKSYIYYFYASTLANFDSFVYGIIGAIIFTYRIKDSSVATTLPHSKNFQIKHTLLISLVSLFTLAGLVTFVGKAGWILPNNYIIRGAFSSVLNIAIIGVILTSLQQRNTFSSLLCSKTMLFVSTLSYSMYVWHYAIYRDYSKIIVSSFHIQNKFLFNIINLLLSIILTVLISMLSYNFIEKPFLIFKKR